MRPLTAFLALLILAALGLVGWVVHRATQDTRDWNTLLALADKDLSQLPDEGLIGRRLQFASAEYSNWKVLVLDGPEREKRILIVLRAEHDDHPIRTLLVSVFDEQRRQLSRANFPVGWGGIPSSLKAVIPGMFCVEVDSIPGSDLLERQYYALVGDRPQLVRVEDKAGVLRQNNYADIFRTVGPPLPPRRPADWEEALRTPDLPSLLGVLVWLGGIHASTSEIWSETIHRPGVRMRIAELAQHPHPWVAEAARALK
jgi:hypothetical protein